VQVTQTDGEREYRSRQVRLGLGLSAVLGGFSVARVVIDWTVAPPWWLWLSLAVLLFYPSLFLLRRTWLSQELLRVGLLQGWWFAGLALMVGFACVDPAGAAIFPIGAALLATSAAGIVSPRGVLAWGVALFAGYLVVLDQHPGSTISLIGLIAGIAGATVWQATSTADSRRELDRARILNEGRIEALLENASDAVIAVTPDGEVVYASSSVRTVLGYEPGWLNSERLSAMTHPDLLVTAQEWMTSIFESPPGSSIRLESRTRHADGTWIDVEVIGSNRLHDPLLGAAVLSIRDISAQKALERDLTRQAFEDSLTGMPNRALFHDRTDHALARNLRAGGRVTLLLIDLDDFKMINDSLGHHAGDLMIKVIAGRIRDQLRPADTLARLGGDEFAVLVEDCTQEQAALLATRLLAALRKPVRVENRDLICTASIGVASVLSGDTEADTGNLLRDADLAMYAAKGAGRDRYALFDSGMYVDILREADDRAEIERALAGNEFTVFYQPIVDLPTSALIGVEALVRWNHPERGLIGPGDFIPLAETTGLIVPLGRLVLEQACAQLALWSQEFPAARQLRMSVNLSARQFQDAGLVEDVARILTTSGVNPSKIVLEITESLLMQDLEVTVDMLNRLKALGLRLAIDDFGTGYSSLSYLKRFPVDILKIDRSFVEGILSHGENATLAEAVVQLGQALQLQTVAEGIETDEQWSTLRELGCDFGQGYLFARPMAAGDIPTFFVDTEQVTALLAARTGS
jgi:diguanylate cyclase (GGDEF)-like protein/PAS domain S-box-containing protein